MFVAVRPVLLRLIFSIQPDAESLPQGGFGHRLQQKIVCTQPEGMERKSRSLHQITRVWGQSARRCSTAFNPSTPGRAITAFVSGSLRAASKSFPDRGNSPFSGTSNVRRRTARSALPEKLPAPCCLSARQFGTQRASFLLRRRWRSLLSVYGQAWSFQAI